MRMPRDKIGSLPVRKAITFGENPSGMVIFLVHSPQVLEHDPAVEVDDLLRLVSLQPAAVLHAMGASVQSAL